jgi:hypothetical protein
VEPNYDPHLATEPMDNFNAEIFSIYIKHFIVLVELKTTTIQIGSKWDTLYAIFKSVCQHTPNPCHQMKTLDKVIPFVNPGVPYNCPH